MTKTKKIVTMLPATFLGIGIGVIWSNAVGVQQESPYLKYSERLGDVVAAIQMMGTYESDSNIPDKWQNIIGARPKSVEFWSDVFTEHPEFFRTSKVNDTIKVSLIWRRARTWSWDIKQQRKITWNSLDYYRTKLPKRLVREPLSAEQTTALIEIAIKMQTQAIARREELRWWVPVVVGALGVLVGALVKS